MPFPDAGGDLQWRKTSAIRLFNIGAYPEEQVQDLPAHRVIMIMP